MIIRRACNASWDRRRLLLLTPRHSTSHSRRSSTINDTPLLSFTSVYILAGVTYRLKKNRGHIIALYLYI